jgi:hypothetical protein
MSRFRHAARKTSEEDAPLQYRNANDFLVGPLVSNHPDQDELSRRDVHVTELNEIKWPRGSDILLPKQALYQTAKLND